MKFPTPTRAGDWRVINGQLVDVSTQPMPASAQPTESGDPPQPKPAVRTRKKRK